MSLLPAIMPTSIPPISGNSRSPLPSGVAPRTSWKYCGAVKNRPNIANDTNVIRIVPHRKLATPNSDRSTSGWLPLRRAANRSHQTKPARTASPATIVASARVSVQPSWPALMNPYVRAVSPALEITMPGKSKRGRFEARDSGSRSVTAASAIATTGTLIRKTEPHQKWSSRKPPTIGPIG